MRSLTSLHESRACSPQKIVAPVGRHGVEQLLNVVADPNDKRVPEVARACLAALGAQLRRLKEQVLEFDRMINAWHRSNEMSRRLDEAPGVGPVLATAVVATPTGRLEKRKSRDYGPTSGAPWSDLPVHFALTCR